MSVLRNYIRRHSYLKRVMSTFYHWINGIPEINGDEITADVIRQCIGKRNPTILEIGSNDGAHTLWFLELFPEATIHSFEPDKRAIKRFRNRVSGQQNVHLHEIAISDHDGVSDFYESHGQRPSDKIYSNSEQTFDWDASGSIKKPLEHINLHPWISFTERHSVPTKKLDTWSKENGIDEIDFIWMDVQGAEMDVFRGARETLDRTRFLYTEYSVHKLYEGQPTLKELLRSLPKFKPIIRYPNDILLESRVAV